MPRSESEPQPLTATVHQSALPAWVSGARSAAGAPHSGTAARMDQEWYINVGGTVEGPVSDEELRDRAATGRLRPTDGVSTDRTKWIAASTVPELTFAAPQPRPLLETVVSGSVPLHDSAGAGPRAAPDVTVPGYQILGPIGAGACGVVYKALHEKLKRVVALKTVLMPDRAPAALLDRFRQEAVALARLHHPNIVAVYDSGMCETPPGQAFFAMELLDGEDLDQRVERTGPLDERTAWLVARQTAGALAHAAKVGVVHRDVKPANLFLVPPPTGSLLPPDVPMVKVTDFGLALTRGGPDETDLRQTGAGVVLGTPVYMAPEQFAGSDVDPRADIYSLGATLFHVLSGRPPFDARTVWEVMRQKAGAPPRLDPPISAETADLVAAMMAPEAPARPTDYGELLARIDALPCLEGGFSVSGRVAVGPLSALTPKPVPPPPVAPRRTRRGYALAAVVLAGAGVGVAALAGAFDRPAGASKAPAAPGAGAAPAAYATGAQHLLYASGSLVGWTPSGGSWEIEQDAEQTPVLAGKGTAVRALKPPPNFRITLTLDMQKAEAVEVVAAATDAPTATRWLVRLDRAAGAAFGKRVGAGAFEPVGAAVPIPTSKELAEEGRRPYLEVKYERAGGTFSAWFRGHPLGSAPDTGLKTTELRVQATGGPVRIDYAALEELIEQK